MLTFKNNPYLLEIVTYVAMSKMCQNSTRGTGSGWSSGWVKGMWEFTMVSI